MSFELSWTIEGEKQLSRRLRGISEGMNDWRPTLKKTAKELVQIFENDVFKTEGNVLGETWDPLSPRYLAKKRADGYSSKPLIRTGAMRKAFQSLVTPDDATIWNAIEYFKYHQSNRPRSRLPRRVMMKLGQDQKALVVRIFQEEFIKKARK